MKKSKKSKSYNPLKMCGSWLGAGVGLIISSIIFWIFLYSKKLFDIVPCNSNLQIILKLGQIVIIGFLAGWIIHSLVRRLN
ncbi:MAG: hypothetical protein AABW81_02560 [Nanoarchaeota archaeon]